MPVLRTIVLLLVCMLLAGCGTDEADRLRDDARAKVEQVRKEAEQLRTRAERLRDRLAKRVRETLDKIEQAIPAAGPLTQPPRRGDASLKAADLPAPRVSYTWIPPGSRVGTGCGHVAGDDAAFYCPSDDTIYLAEAFADQVLHGGGDFGLSYVVAHEYAHNVQQELGWFRAGRQVAVKPFELQADCLAGTWGNSVYQRGRLKPGDVEEALRTAYAVGDFDRLNPQHHGTPVERRDAWLRGYRSGDPSSCQAYVPT